MVELELLRLKGAVANAGKNGASRLFTSSNASLVSLRWTAMAQHLAELQTLRSAHIYDNKASNIAPQFTPPRSVHRMVNNTHGCSCTKGAMRTRGLKAADQSQES